jgi:hypothetical protein
MDKIVRRIGKEAGVPDLAEVLSERISPTDLQSLHLEVYRRIARRRSPPALLADYLANRFTHPSSCHPSLILEWDRIAYSHLPASFEAIELSTVCPIGTVSSITSLSQDWVLTTIRNTEVVADPTNVLAMECAVRRRQLTRTTPANSTVVNLACSHRSLRAQRYSDPNMLSHFRLFSLCSAGRDTGNFRFETGVLADHIRFYLESLRHYLGSSVPLKIIFNDLSADRARVEPLIRLKENIENEYHHTRFEFEPSSSRTKSYYRKFRFHIYAGRKGEEVELVDGGDTDWTQKLLNNAKERLVISGIGSERLCMRFGHPEKTV